MPVPLELTASELQDGVVLLSFPVSDVTADESSQLLVSLTPAQRVVVLIALTGAADAEIARITGRSRYSVSNLLRQAYRRLGVSTRGELCALFSRDD